METKEDLVLKIKELLQLEEKIHVLKRQKDILDKQRKTLSAELIQVMKQHEIFQLETSNSTIRFRSNKTKPISKKILTKLLADFYKEDSQKAEEVQSFIFENIPERVNERIIVKTDT